MRNNGLLLIDGVQVAIGQTILFKDQTDQQYNGVYTVTQITDLGAGTYKYVFTLWKSYITSVDLTTIIYVKSGTLNFRLIFGLCITVVIITVWQTLMEFVQLGLTSQDVLDTIPLTTKGDVLSHDDTQLVRVPVGVDGTVLTANSATTSGLGWAVPAGAFLQVRSVGNVGVSFPNAGTEIPITQSEITITDDMSTAFLSFSGYFAPLIVLNAGEGYIMQASFQINGTNFPTIVSWLDITGAVSVGGAVNMPVVFNAAVPAGLSAGDVVRIKLRTIGNSIGYTGLTAAGNYPFPGNLTVGQMSVIGI